MKKLLLLLLCVPLIGVGQEKISVNDIRNLFSEDFSNNCINVDTIKANPFTGVIYLSYWKDRCEPLKAIMHYEDGYRDGMDIDLAATGEIISITNWSKGVWTGVQYFNSYANYASKKYRTRFQNNFYNRGTSYWSRDELLKGGFIKKTTIDTPHILQFDIRRDNNGALIYQRYYNAEGKEIPKIQYDKLEYLNK